MKATWKKGLGSLYKADAQKVAEEIMAIGSDVKPQQIVDAAKDKKSELHKCFEWNDKAAAEKYRLHQARMLVTCLVIEQEEPKEYEVRVFYKNDTGGYKPTQYIYQIPDEHAKLLQQAYAELRAFKIKYAALQELDEIFKLID